MLTLSLRLWLVFEMFSFFDVLLLKFSIRSVIFHACYVASHIHVHWGSNLQLMKLLMIPKQFSPTSRFFLPFRLKYLHQNWLSGLNL
jgi:hypothetical protein